MYGSLAKPSGVSIVISLYMNLLKWLDVFLQILFLSNIVRRSVCSQYITALSSLKMPTQVEIGVLHAQDNPLCRRTDAGILLFNGDTKPFGYDTGCTGRPVEQLHAQEIAEAVGIAFWRISL